MTASEHLQPKQFGPRPSTSNPLSADYIPTPETHAASSFDLPAGPVDDGYSWGSENASLYGGYWS